MVTGPNGEAGQSAIIFMVKEHHNEPGNVLIQAQKMEESNVLVTNLQVQKVKYAMVSKIAFPILISCNLNRVNKVTYYSLFIECKNSGQYSDEQCSSWMDNCKGGQYGQFMIDHCSKTCGFCTLGTRLVHELFFNFDFYLRCFYTMCLQYSFSNFRNKFGLWRLLGC